jgi:hypothetical protein
MSGLDPDVPILPESSYITGPANAPSSPRQRGEHRRGQPPPDRITPRRAKRLHGCLPLRIISLRRSRSVSVEEPVDRGPTRLRNPPEGRALRHPTAPFRTGSARSVRCRCDARRLPERARAAGEAGRSGVRPGLDRLTRASRGPWPARVWHQHETQRLPGIGHPLVPPPLPVRHPGSGVAVVPSDDSSRNTGSAADSSARGST